MMLLMEDETEKYNCDVAFANNFLEQYRSRSGKSYGLYTSDSDVLLIS